MKKVSAILLVVVLLTFVTGCGTKLTESAAREAKATQETISADIKAQLDAVLSENNFKGC